MNFITEPFATPGPLTSPPWNARTELTIEDGSDIPTTLEETEVIDGLLTIQGGFGEIFLEHDNPPPSPNHWAEAVVQHDPDVGGAASVRFLLRAFGGIEPAPGEINAIFIGFRAWADASVNLHNAVYDGSDQSGDWWTDEDTSVIVLEPGPQEVRYRVEVEGTFLRAFINNILVGSGDYSLFVSEEAKAAFDLGNRLFIIPEDDTGHITEINAGTLPYGISEFWQDFVGTQEKLP